MGTVPLLASIASSGPGAARRRERVADGDRVGVRQPLPWGNLGDPHQLRGSNDASNERASTVRQNPTAGSAAPLAAEVAASGAPLAASTSSAERVATRADLANKAATGAISIDKTPIALVDPVSSTMTASIGISTTMTILLPGPPSATTGNERASDSDRVGKRQPSPAGDFGDPRQLRSSSGTS